MSGLRLFLNWILENDLKKEKNSLVEMILCYLPGCDFEQEEDYDCISYFVDYCKCINSPTKVYGVSIFIYTFLKNHFEIFDHKQSHLTEIPEYQAAEKLKISWEQLEKQGFNPESLYRCLFHSIEHKLYGEE